MTRMIGDGGAEREQAIIVDLHDCFARERI